MDPMPLPTYLADTNFALSLEALAPSLALLLWRHIESDRLHPRRRNGWPGVSDLGSLQGFLASFDFQNPHSPEFAYAIIENRGDFIGTLHVFNVDWALKSFEIGYGVHHRYEGRGFASAAVRLLEKSLAELGFELSQITCPGWNLRSLAVAERCGYSFVKRHHEGCQCPGCDECMHFYQKSLRALS